MLQVTAVDDQFGTHRIADPLVASRSPTAGPALSCHHPGAEYDAQQLQHGLITDPFLHRVDQLVFRIASKQFAMSVSTTHLRPLY